MYKCLFWIINIGICYWIIFMRYFYLKGFWNLVLGYKIELLEFIKSYVFYIEKDCVLFIMYWCK